MSFTPLSAEEKAAAEAKYIESEVSWRVEEEVKRQVDVEVKFRVVGPGRYRFRSPRHPTRHISNTRSFRQTTSYDVVRSFWQAVCGGGAGVAARGQRYG